MITVRWSCHRSVSTVSLVAGAGSPFPCHRFAAAECISASAAMLSVAPWASAEGLVESQKGGAA